MPFLGQHQPKTPIPKKYKIESIWVYKYTGGCGGPSLWGLENILLYQYLTP